MIRSMMIKSNSITQLNREEGCKKKKKNSLNFPKKEKQRVHHLKQIKEKKYGYSQKAD